MRHIDLESAPDQPEAWKRLESKHRAGLVGLQDSDGREYVRSNAGWSTLKSWLSALSGEKCWYCEASSRRAVFDVDHYRPKLAVTVDGAAVVSHPGYWWLAFDSRNYRLACQTCNRPSTADAVAAGKRNEFPLREESCRVVSAGGTLEAEEPRLLDPCVEHDTKLLSHYLDGEVRARDPAPSWESSRAQYTIILLRMNDPVVTEYKRGRWQDISTMIRLADLSGEVDEVQARLKALLDPSAEYGSFWRAAIETHSDKPWVAALL